MKKGKSYGSQMFKTTGFEANQKDLNEIAEEYFMLCTIRGISYVTINSYRYAKRYLVMRNSKNDDILFPTVYNDVLSTSTINKELEKYNRSRGVDLTGIRRHRHTFITNCINKNTIILIMKKITGIAL